MSTTATRAETNRTSVSAVSQTRREAVDRARQAWIRKLTDLSRRNNLLYYRPLKTGTLDLSSADSLGLSNLLSGEGPVSIARLIPNAKDDTVSNLREISRRAQANFEEKGLRTLFVALGRATWTASDGGKPADAAVLLLPVALEMKGSRSCFIKRSGVVQINLVLLDVLDTQFGVRVASENLIPQLVGDDEREPFDPSPLYAELSKQAADVPGFEVKPTARLGNFAFHKMAMVKDLQERGSALAEHDIVAAIAGDEEARSVVGMAEGDQDPKQLDRVPPDNEFIVLDADSSQQCAIANVLSGQNAVIHGPPGNGKSQTIGNIIATLAATGHRVLFVAEKRAALVEVLKRLAGVGLSHLAIDLHGADLSPRKVMQQVAEALDKVRNALPAEFEQIHKQFADRRNKLNEHVERIHQTRRQTGLSIYEMQGKLLWLGDVEKTASRWRGDELLRLDPETAERIGDLLSEAAAFESLFLRIDPSPWTGAKLSNGSAVENAVDLVYGAHTQAFPAFTTSLHTVVQETGLSWPGSVAAARSLMTLVGTVQTKLEAYNPAIYEQDHASLLRVLARGRSGGLSAASAWATNSAYRQARKLIRELRIAGPASASVLFSELAEVEREAVQWKRLAQNDSVPHTIAEFPLHQKKCDALFSDVSALALVLPTKQRLESLTIEDLGNLLDHLANDNSTPHQIPKLSQIEARLQAIGVGKLVDEIRDKKLENRLWPRMFQYSWLTSTLDAVCQNDAEVRGFKGIAHNRYVDEFVHLDEERITLAAERVRRAHGLHAIEAMNAHPEQQHIIRAQAAKVRGHLPLRRVFTQAADVLTAVCPCWIVSPLSVSQLLDGGKQYFDFVIFDEASQIVPEDAVPAILRAKKVVVAGDNEQLPPTRFFAASEEDEYAADEEAGASEGFESLLDMMIPFVRSCYLRWHYRSRDESLINFSNHHIYQGRLVTFPGPGGPPAINHELVEQEGGIDGQQESSESEARKVAELVIRHAQEHPDETLGVITMGIRHMNRVQAALDQQVEKYPELEKFFDPNAPERFFVKNLERVQGDERDAIIISIGYGKDRAGNPPRHFGPLAAETGRRRLNVAITRARQKMTVVSSFSYADIDLARIRAGSGVELLRHYLQYAASEGKILTDSQLTTVPLNDFEASVFDVLTSRGIKLIPQLGASQYRIDMVAQHPNKPGRFVLAIECDGATYHSSCTARDRDRLRQQQLENLGWRVYRIWSTDWFMRPEAEGKRAIEAYQSAVVHADNLDAGVIQNGHLPENGNDKATTDKGTSSPATKRMPRPHIPLRTSIAQYSLNELCQLILWLSSDGRLRTDDEIIAEIVSILRFSRRGARIEAAIRSALQRYHAMSSGLSSS